MEVSQSEDIIFVNDNKNALFFLDNNVTSNVRFFSVISAPLDQGPHEVQFQLVPKFSHAFFLSTHFWVFAKHLINFCKIHHFWQKFAFFEKSVIAKVTFFAVSFEFCSNFSCILPKFAIFGKFAILVKISNYQQAIFSSSHLNFCKPLITSCQIRYFHQICHFVKIANSQHGSFVISFNFLANLKWIVAKFGISVIITICQGTCPPLFVTSFVKF